MNAYEVLKERGFIEQLTHEDEIKELFEKGVNDSLVHVDFMMGTEDLMIDGILEDGRHVKIFENGNFVF